MGIKTRAQFAEDFEMLVEELMKDKPSSNLVRQLSLKLGLPYNSDLVTQMNTVLQEADRFFHNKVTSNTELEN